MESNNKFKCPNCEREGTCSISYEYTDDLNERFGGELLEYYTCKCCGHRSRSYNFTRVKSR